MSRAEKNGQQHLNRLQLIARVQLAYEQVRDAMSRASKGSPSARLAVTLARRRLEVLNRALAMVALQSSAA
jgi:hypothetical protein